MYVDVQIDGPLDEIRRFHAAHICNDNDGNDMLDFNSIIPMPLELEDTESGGYTDVLIWALGGELYSQRNVLRKIGMHSADDTPLDRAWLRELGIATREELLRWAEKELPDELDTARRVFNIEHSTGYRSWYDWQHENWGCKWGCCGFGWLSDEKTAFYMDTPWSAPTPIFRKLVELYPALTFSCHFEEPGEDIDYIETFTA
jgi:hypothetical protein